MEQQFCFDLFGLVWFSLGWFDLTWSGLIWFGGHAWQPRVAGMESEDSLWQSSHHLWHHFPCPPSVQKEVEETLTTNVWIEHVRAACPAGPLLATVWTTACQGGSVSREPSSPLVLPATCRVLFS